MQKVKIKYTHRETDGKECGEMIGYFLGISPMAGEVDEVLIAKASGRGITSFSVDEIFHFEPLHDDPQLKRIADEVDEGLSSVVGAVYNAAEEGS